VPSRSYDADNPATWTLPIEAYLPTDDERSQLYRAKVALIGDCMKEAGYAEWRAAPELPKLGPKTLTDWRYGIHDEELAARRGYKPEAAEQAAYDEAVRAGAVDGTASGGREDKALSQCAQESMESLGGADAAEYGVLAESLSNETFLRSKREPEVVKAFAAWSSCMKSKGYSYKEPLDANDDPRFASAKPTKLELSTATADIACRQDTKVARTWWEAEVRLQKEAVERNAESLDEGREKLDNSVKDAAAVLAGKK
jgi:hypothetical protein